MTDSLWKRFKSSHLHTVIQNKAQKDLTSMRYTFSMFALISNFIGIIVVIKLL